MKNQNKSFSLLIFFLLIFLFLFLGISLFFNLNKPLDSREFEVRFEVGDVIGFNTDTDVLDFGILSHGMSSTRSLNLTNKFDFDVLVETQVSEGLERYISAKPQLVLSSGEEAEYKVLLGIPSNSEMGNYSGIIKLNFYKKK